MKRPSVHNKNMFIIRLEVLLRLFRHGNFSVPLRNGPQVISFDYNYPIRADSSPVVFIQEIQRRERWEPRKGALHAYMKTTGDESAIRASQYMVLTVPKFIRELGRVSKF